ncbi:MAG: ABC transporter substrate-binding protein [Alicyclobacillus sp.]|nr:ABC transporter substrate-binding protein [Alicyclobacillus sp.]
MKSIAVLAVSAALAGCAANTVNQGAGVRTLNQASGLGEARLTTGGFPITLIDDAGQKVTVPKKPVRIASVTEGTDEILSALVPKRDVVLVTSYATDPSESNVVQWAKGIKSIQSANAEAVIAVHPDLALLASYNKAGVVQQIEHAGIPTYEFNMFNNIGDIERNIRIVGKLTGETAKADDVIMEMNEEIAAIRAAVRREKKVTVLNTSSYGYAAGSGTTVNDIIVDAGGINAAAQLKGWAPITPEQIVKLNPDVIVLTTGDKAYAKQLETDPKFQTVNAIKHHRVYFIPSADLMSVSQYIVKGIRDVAHALYPTAKLPK